MEILLQIVLILVNAFFAGTEMAVVSLNATKLRKLQEEGDKTAGDTAENGGGFLRRSCPPSRSASPWPASWAAAFAGETTLPTRLSNWVYNDLGFQAIPPGALNTLAVIIITIILSYFTLILGELVPKRVAMQKP